MLLEFKWTVSRGRDTYGYNICSLYVDGQKVSACNGGGYDMKGTALGNWIARTYADRLCALSEQDMPENSHWEPDFKAVICYQCATDRALNGQKPYSIRLDKECPDEWPNCPGCGKPMDRDRRAGKRVNDGRGFYGLTFHDPHYDPGKATIGRDCDDRTLGDGAAGKTVERAESEGTSFGLERYQAIYRASSPHATERHTVPSIDGACGFSSVEKIMGAIGLTFGVTSEPLRTRSRKVDLYLVRDTLASQGG